MPSTDKSTDKTKLAPPLDQFDLSTLHPNQAKLLSDALKKSGLYDEPGNTLSPSRKHAFTARERRVAVGDALSFIAGQEQGIEVAMPVFVDAKHLTLCAMVMTDLLEALAYKAERSYHSARVARLEAMVLELEATLAKFHSRDISASHLFVVLEPAVRRVIETEYGSRMEAKELHRPKDGFPRNLVDDVGILIRWLVHVGSADFGGLRG
ncbi:hypothetical protein MBLNU230_g6158t1 [Neophaeotheca triangularis]